LLKEFPPHRWSSSKPQWDGSDLGDRTILLYCEQGFGDILQFIRYVPMVAKRGGKVIVTCPAELLRLFQSVTGVAGWVAFDEPLPSFDIHCPLMSLPLAFGTTVQTIPRSVPYLHADTRDIGRWRDRLAGGPAGLKVGLVWAGRSEHKNDHNRSIPLSILASVARAPGVSFLRVPSTYSGQALRAPLLGDSFLPTKNTKGTEKKAKLQALVEKIHASWPIDRDYIAPPTWGKLVTLDASLIVTPPKGMEVGYVPIVTAQALPDQKQP
jgi:hypothetical protein